MYRSPLRQDDNASFSVCDSKNVWYDFGTGEGGGLKKLVEKLGDGGIFEQHVPAPKQKGLEIVRVRPLEHEGLLRYLEKRAVSREVAQRECRQVWYKIGDRKTQFAIGFENILGGWELRTEKWKGGSSPKGISIRRQDGGSDTVVVFEGFIDYLSYLTMKKGEIGDVVVLNSVVNVDKALDFIRGHREVRLVLDNDDAGREAVKKIGIGEDFSWVYGNFNDFNEYAMWKKSH